MAYVLIHNGGTEGHGKPVQVFDEYRDAERELHLANGASFGGSWVVYEVPKHPAKAEFDAKEPFKQSAA